MDKIQKLKQEKQYEQYVKEKTPRHNLFLNMCKAFFLGGLICLLGQVIYHYFELRNLSPDECSRWMSLSLILLSVLFTGTGIYQKLAAWGGSWGGMQGVDESALPVTCVIDYIRVFQKK